MATVTWLHSGSFQWRDLDDESPWVIGRSDDAHIRILDETVSRLQALIGREGKAYSIEPFPAAPNPTNVNGKAITGTTPLPDGAILTFGAARATFHAVELAPQPEMVVCPHCGRKISAGEFQCPFDGQNLAPATINRDSLLACRILSSQGQAVDLVENSHITIGSSGALDRRTGRPAVVDGAIVQWRHQLPPLLTPASGAALTLEEDGEHLVAADEAPIELTHGFRFSLDSNQFFVLSSWRAAWPKKA